jgi:hypothetical protein
VQVGKITFHEIILEMGLGTSTRKIIPGSPVAVLHLVATSLAEVLNELP